MSYILGLCLEYNRYRRDAIVRIYADNLLIDELTLSDGISLKTKNISGFPRWFIGPENFSRVMILPEKIFLYEIEETYLQKSIRIEIENNNNNYNNGFMTRFSSIKFHHIFLVPNCLLEEKTWQKIKHMQVPVTYNISPEYNNYFPYIPFDNVIFKPETIKQQIGNNKWKLFNIGGSFSIEIPLYRKFNIVHLGRLLPGRVVVRILTAQILMAYNVLNIYNEDQ